MKQTYVLGLFLGTISAVRFATGMEGTENLNEDFSVGHTPVRLVQDDREVPAEPYAMPKPHTFAQAAPAAAAGAAAAAAPAAKSPCNPGETVGPDGNCYFEGEAV